MAQPARGTGDSSAIVAVARRFAEAKCLLTADELGLFGLLQAGPSDAGEISAKLGIRDHAAPDFLSVLVALGVLETADGKYANSPDAARFLVPGSAEYLGSMLGYYNKTLYPTWGNLTELLTRPQGEGTVDGNARENFSELLEDPDRARTMLDMMVHLNGFLGPALAAEFDWSEHRSVVDLGGSTGQHVIDLVSAHPHLRGGVFDLPPIGRFAAEKIAAAGLTERVEFHPGDFFADDFPPADVYVFGHILHNFAPQTRYALVAKAYETLNPGGAVLVVDRMVDEQRADMARLVESLHLYVISDGGGSDYRPSDCQEYLTAARFTRTSVRALTDAETLVTGYKETR
ncbi:methyltransferase [Amycolatopsis sp. NPDC024027]|uniref:methyltransferase n=1 Tax=Amycolatopsis sp. NPDC024027 TaxID=3154327 RepID=UPI0033C2F17F